MDTPGHQDFAEDTFRTLTAVDSVIIVIDVAKGVEAQTRKLMEVCRMRKTPVIVFINKMDRDGKDPFDLLDEIEEELHINVRPLSWPIDMGQRFRGVYNIYEQKLNLYTPSKQYVTENIEFKDIQSPELEQYIVPTWNSSLPLTTSGSPAEHWCVKDLMYPRSLNSALYGLSEAGVYVMRNPSLRHCQRFMALSMA